MVKKRFLIGTFIVPIFLLLTGCETRGISNNNVLANNNSVSNSPSTHISKMSFKMSFVYQPPHMWNSTQGWVITGSTTQLSNLFVTNDGGVNWKNISPALQFYYKGTGAFYNQSFGWFVELDPGQQFIVERTTDGGRTWTSSSPVATPYGDGKMQIDRISKEVGYIAIGSAGMTNPPSALYRTTDGGKTWVRLPNTPTSGKIKFISSLNGWLSGWNFTPNDLLKKRTGHTGQGYTWLYKTKNEGKSWNRVQLPVPISLRSDWISGENLFFHAQWGAVVFYFSGNSGTNDVYKLYVTNDGGRNWSIYDLPMTPNEGIQGSLDLQFVSNSIGYLQVYTPRKNSSLPGTLQWFQTVNGGRTWLRLSTGLPMDASIRFQSSEFWLAVNHSELLKTQTAGRSWIKIYNK